MKRPRRGQKWKKKRNEKGKDPREGKLRREWVPYGERPKRLPYENSEWGVYFGTNAYSSVKTWEQ